MKKTTINIGISAFNEENNIKLLLSGILRQTSKDFMLKNIIIISDGSTDNTNKIVSGIKSKKIKLIQFRKRAGKAARINQIFKMSDTDILVIFDADTSIKSTNFLTVLIQPIIHKKADLTSANAKELSSITFMEKLLVRSMDYKKTIYDSMNNGNNIYNCFGYCRAFSKQLYKNTIIPDSVGEDAYTYLYATYNNLAFKTVKSAVLQYRLPKNFGDHKKQSLRFFQSKKRFIKEFGADYVNEAYAIPPLLLLTMTIKYTIKNPSLILYFLILIYIKIVGSRTKKILSTWDISKSSKILVS